MLQFFMRSVSAKGLWVGLLLVAMMGNAVAQSDGADAWSVMHPDREMLRSWQSGWLAAPRTESSAKDAVFKDSVNLLPYLEYVPEERNQGHCGNCWVWAGTACMEVEFGYRYGIRESLSVQFVNSNFEGRYACCGGFVQDLVNFYNAKRYCIPTSNWNAVYADKESTCLDGASVMPASEMDTAPRYWLNQVSTALIPTTEMLQEDAIANIKYQLSLGKAIVFAFYMPTEESLEAFYSFWGEQGEETPYDPTLYKDMNFDMEHGAGHAVLCVGYDENGWIILNSWATNGGGRPAGLFRLGPIETLDYNAVYLDEENEFSMMQWWTLDVGLKGLDTDGDHATDALEIERGTDPADPGDSPLPLNAFPAILVFLLAGGYVVSREGLQYALKCNRVKGK